MNTRELAAMMRKTADYLDSIEEFDSEDCFSFISNSKNEIRSSALMWDKSKFIAAVKAISPATKKYDTGEYAYLRVTSSAFPLELNINRDKVCKKIVTFDCEPLFSTEEVDAL